MNNLAASWVRRFLVEHLIGERNYSANTQQSYRDTFRLFLPFAGKRCRCAVDRLLLNQLTPKAVREFLRYLENTRGCAPSTVNQRLAALRAWAQFVGTNAPEHLEWSHQVQAIHLKKHAPAPMMYLEKEEMRALLEAPDRANPQGFRDYTVLLFLYNTGARASEAAGLTIGDVDLALGVVTLHGKGSKTRQCPLWKNTITAMRELTAGRVSNHAVFCSQRGGSQPMTRYGVHTLVERYAKLAALKTPTIQGKRVSPHRIRHTTAMHLLRSGVDINTIRVWLGHVSLKTTFVYAESDLRMKAKALRRCEAPLLRGVRPRQKENGIISFLKSV
jgi:integrase/recombinase XerD